MEDNIGFTSQGCPLAELPEHTWGRITQVFGEGFWRRRLLELGFTPGTVVEVVRTSLVGDPVAYRIKGTTIALRKEQAALIFVQPLFNATCIVGNS
ncbi:ferrous iron transport protein A [Thermanaeromonas toyohensis ToBE]|uniref:Ferrous iron transport protein A n=1 Tax=Thermanaeromonas toyohensis ToBE TaxID=698762 RepID=A0A1W1W2R3_9FIRM|nr:FeoA family protein [Thermanaeromonas toyohensis]SMB99898.1 ferrous iron transport protein A [Thermanaeromonas toyohensis ToBE]